MQKFYSMLAFWMATVCVSAQNGTIIGSVTEAGNSDPIPFANVVLKGTETGASTNFDGEFEMSAPAGTYSIEFTFIGYQVVIQENVKVEAGKTLVLNQKMDVASAQLAEVEIVTKADRESQTALVLDRKQAATLKENIGSRDLVKKGASNVQEGLAKVTGVSQVASRGVYVRGLGDRYNNVYLNGLPLPSPNPNRKVIDLDIFPTAIVRNIDVYKTFNVNQFGDMSGASLNIFTKDVPEDGFMSVSIGANYNSNSSMKNFRTNRDGDLSYLGFDGNGRQQPEITEDGVAQFVENDGDPFQTNFGYQEMNAPLDARYSLRGGKGWKTGDDGKMGFTAAISHRNNHRFDQGFNNILDASQTPTANFLRSRWRRSANTTGLFSYNYSPNAKHSFDVNYLFINQADNNFILSEGTTDELDNPEQNSIVKHRSRYEQKRLNNVQFISKNDFTKKFGMRWGGSFSKANTDEPDRRDVGFLTQQGESETGSFNAGTGGVLQRYFQNTNEREYYAFAEGIFKFGESENISYEDKTDQQKLVIGYQRKGKKREVGSIIYNVEFPPNSTLVNAQVPMGDLNSVFTDENYNSGLYKYRINRDNSNTSTAQRTIDAAYAYLDFNVSPRFKIVPGVRAEYSPQTVSYFKLGAIDPEMIEQNEVEILPSVAMKFTANESNIFRLSGSKTLTRPNFQELILVPFVNENQQSIVGNAFLENSTSYNSDFKYENYTPRGDFFSAGVFYKYIDAPIEQVRSGVNFISYFNMNFAHVAGLEVDFTRRLSSFFQASEKTLVRHLYFDGNLTLMHTEVSTTELDERTQQLLQNVTEDKRALQGASPYLVNVSVGFDQPWTEKTESSNVSVSFNYFGDRIYNVGTQKRGDEYEKGFATLNIVAQHAWKNGFSLKLAMQNLLNPAIEREQKAGPEASGDVITQSFKRGVNVGLTASYDLF